MGKNITWLGVSYTGVEAMTLPLTGGGEALFSDASVTTAVESDVAQGKIFLKADGSQGTGTSSGGGGSSNWTLLASQEFTVNTTSTSNKSVGDISLTLSDYNDKNTVLWVHVRDKAGKRNGYAYGTDTIFFHYQLANDSTNSLSVRPVMNFSVSSSGTYSGTASAYGVFGYRLYYTSSSHYVQIYSRYNSSYGTINGTFKCDVYKLTMPTGTTLFT